MTIPVIVTGDDVAIAVTLYRNDAVFAISGTGVVKAAIVSVDHTTAYTAAVTQSSAAAGADYANSLIVVEFATTDTDGVTYQGPALLEIQVDDDGKTTHFVPVTLVRGAIA